MSNIKTNQKKERKRTAVLLGLLFFLFFVSISGLKAQELTFPKEWYDAISWTWWYAGPADDDYNCLAYALGNTNQWIWPWGGSNATSSQVDNYLKNKGYYKGYKYGYTPSIISYGPSYNSISHFSKVTRISNCRAKWGRYELMNHGSWDPYRSGSSYGSKRSIYYLLPMYISIGGPTHLEDEGDYQWNAQVLRGLPPYSYKWYFTGAGYNHDLMSMYPFVDLEGIFDDDVLIELEVTEATGYTAWDSIYVTVGGGGGGERSNQFSGLESVSDKVQIAANVSNLLEEAKAKNIISSNPYDYIDSHYFREIVQMGPIALMTIRKMILTSVKNGLKEYILAIASEKIARVDLKGDSFSWTNAKEYRREWDKHIRMLPSNFAKIIASDQSIENKNKALVKLGIPAIPFIIDEVALGKNEFKRALIILLGRPTPLEERDIDKNFETVVRENVNNIRILRKLTDAYRK